MERWDKLVTEERSAYTDLDAQETADILRIINDEDQKAVEAVRLVLPQVARAVHLIVGSFERGGRLFYIGAGTSGRLGVLDASEAPPTFGVPPTMITGIIAGGKNALVTSAEDAEDREEAGADDLVEAGATSKDVVVGIAASGRTPYVVGALRKAREIGAKTVSLACNDDSVLARHADVAIAPIVGPEVLMGSTRMKSGTAQKLVLNMLSTVSMIKIGKVYSNLMVDLQAANEKLWVRGVRIVQLATGAAADVAEKAFQEAGGKAKVAIVMLLTESDARRAGELLQRAGGFVRRALELARS